ncbi:SRPBCC family protein [Deinococcus sp.]|uniref:SRPBCC family protein n=1 Tax=Deinococcus sp. TaxID=47478 RepID=UPI003C7B34A0
MSEYIIVKDYPQPRPVVWKALTDPALIPLWTSTGQGGRPEGFLPEAGTKFRFIGKPFPGWDGVVLCEVLDAQAPALLRFSWRNKPEDQPSVVTNRLEDIPGGTRLTYEHTGFQGIEGFMMSKLLGNVRRKMLNQGLPAVLDDLDDHGQLRPGSTLRPKDIALSGS